MLERQLDISDTAWGISRSALIAGGSNLQSGLRRAIVAAITAQRLQSRQQMPPSRLLAQQLGIARNTVTAVYEELATRGYLVSVERKGFFVAGDTRHEPKTEEDDHEEGHTLVWSERLTTQISSLRHISKPIDWQSYTYPFIYGQVDPNLFPLAAWRSASRDALGRAAVNWWAADNANEDDPLLIEQIRRHVLPRRGIFARPDEVLITLGAQEGLYLLSRLLVRHGDQIGVENPGYTDARHIFSLSPGTLRDLPVDAQGVRAGPDFEGLSLAVLTPGCHCPTGVSLSPERRQWLLDWSASTDALIIEDDYEGEMAADDSLTALKSADRGGRVIYLGTFSKVIAPGVRLGYMVGPAPLIAEARALRRLIHRSAPLNTQRLAAMFMVEGHYQGLVRQLRSEIQIRLAEARNQFTKVLPGLDAPSGDRGSALWARCPANIDLAALDEAARVRGVLFERGDPFFSEGQPAPFMRLGLSAIAQDKIRPGLERLADALEAVS